MLTRIEATHALGLMDSSQRPARGVRLACRDRFSGNVFEAEEGEYLHAQIALRVKGALEDGWTVTALQASSVAQSYIDGEGE